MIKAAPFRIIALKLEPLIGTRVLIILCSYAIMNTKIHADAARIREFNGFKQRQCLMLYLLSTWASCFWSNCYFTWRHINKIFRGIIKPAGNHI